MPRIPSEILNCAVYIYENIVNAKEGERVGGSGFLVGVRTCLAERWNLHLYVVTNSHVIEACGSKPAIRLNGKDGHSEFLETTDKSWIHAGHDDLAIRPITLSIETHEFFFLDADRFLSKANLFEIGPGMDVFMVGRFIAHDGKQRNLPSLRFGNVAMMPLEPIAHPTKTEQDSFLIETRSIGGYSGSPVFSYVPPGSIHWSSRSPRGIKRADAPLEQHEVRFIGVDGGHLLTYDQVVQEDKRTPVFPHQWVRSNSGMSGVVPAWKLTELLYCDEAKMQRAKDDEKISNKKNESVAVLDSAKKPFTKSDFEAALMRVSRKLSDQK